ncbi:MAG: hypothetical protein WD810_01625 [Solirubrobacterales bacterium]
MLAPLDRDEWEQREIYAKFGLAVYFCQVLEAGLVTYLVLLRRATEERPATTEEVDELYAELFGNTLGRNIKNVRRLLGEEGEWILEEQVTAALALRNDLVHQWMRTRVLRQGTSENRLAMIEELETARAVLEDADRVLGERTQVMMAKAGVPEEFVQEELKRLTELGERGEEDPEAPPYFAARSDE